MYLNRKLLWSSQRVFCNEPHRVLCSQRRRPLHLSSFFFLFAFFGVPCNGASSRYDDTAGGPVARVTGSGQRYTPRVGGSSSSAYLFSLLVARADQNATRTPTVNTVMTRSPGPEVVPPFHSVLLKPFNGFPLFAQIRTKNKIKKYQFLRRKPILIFRVPVGRFADRE